MIDYARWRSPLLHKRLIIRLSAIDEALQLFSHLLVVAGEFRKQLSEVVTHSLHFPFHFVHAVIQFTNAEFGLLTWMTCRRAVPARVGWKVTRWRRAIALSLLSHSNTCAATYCSWYRFNECKCTRTEALVFLYESPESRKSKTFENFITSANLFRYSRCICISENQKVYMLMLAWLWNLPVTVPLQFNP